MTDEEKKIAETVKAMATGDEPATKDTDADEPEVGGDEPATTDEPAEDLTKEDYADMLKKEREAREKAEKEIADKAFQAREAKRKKKEDDDEDEDKPLTKRELQDLLSSERQATQKTLAEREIKAIAEKMSGSEGETALIVEIHKNRTFPPHLTLQEQVEEAYAIANRKKLIVQNKELTRALKSKETSTKSVATDTKPTSPVAEGKLSNQDARAIKDSGMIWDGVKRAYKKPLGDGKTFYFYDPKSKRRWKE